MELGDVAIVLSYYFGVYLLQALLFVELSQLDLSFLDLLNPKYHQIEDCIKQRSLSALERSILRCLLKDKTLNQLCSAVKKKDVRQLQMTLLGLENVRLVISYEQYGKTWYRFCG